MLVIIVMDLIVYSVMLLYLIAILVVTSIRWYNAIYVKMVLIYPTVPVYRHAPRVPTIHQHHANHVKSTVRYARQLDANNVSLD